MGRYLPLHPFATTPILSLSAHWDLSLTSHWHTAMDFVPSSQPWQDGNDELYIESPRLPSTNQARSPRFGVSVAALRLLQASDAESEFVGTSQPSEDGEEYFCNPNITASDGGHHRRRVEGAAPCSPRSPPSEASLQRRARLVRRVPPTELCPNLVAGGPVQPRCFNLVRRVTLGPTRAVLWARDTERKRQRARDKAAAIVRKLRRLATATARLHRKHRELRAFAAGLDDNKENMC
ncbi:hypothetical protein C8R46DRAFT_1356354 [Mycena filopes]|nr:hypothetical protein C8R46DRAFT_1356354 [Mycena filopes]